MQNVVLSPIGCDKLVELISDRVTSDLLKALKSDQNQPEPKDDPLDDYIERKEVVGKLASASTLWKWEKAGKLQSYGIGGKRYYKRSEIEGAFTKMK